MKYTRQLKSMNGQSLKVLIFMTFSLNKSAKLFSLCIMFRLILLIEYDRYFLNQFLLTEMLESNSLIKGFMGSLLIIQPLSLFIRTGLPVILLPIINLSIDMCIGLLNIYNLHNVDKWIVSKSLQRFQIFGNLISTYFWIIFPIKQNINLYMLQNGIQGLIEWLCLIDFILNYTVTFYSIYCNQTFEYSRKYQDQFKKTSQSPENIMFCQCLMSDILIIFLDFTKQNQKFVYLGMSLIFFGASSLYSYIKMAYVNRKVLRTFFAYTNIMFCLNLEYIIFEIIAVPSLDAIYQFLFVFPFIIKCSQNLIDKRYNKILLDPIIQLETIYEVQYKILMLAKCIGNKQDNCSSEIKLINLISEGHLQDHKKYCNDTQCICQVNIIDTFSVDEQKRNKILIVQVFHKTLDYAIKRFPNEYYLKLLASHINIRHLNQLPKGQKCLQNIEDSELSTNRRWHQYLEVAQKLSCRLHLTVIYNQMIFILKNQLLKKQIQEKETHSQAIRIQTDDEVLRIEKPLSYMEKLQQIIKLGFICAEQREKYWLELKQSKPNIQNLLNHSKKIKQADINFNESYQNIQQKYKAFLLIKHKLIYYLYLRYVDNQLIDAVKLLQYCQAINKQLKESEITGLIREQDLFTSKFCILRLSGNSKDQGKILQITQTCEGILGYSQIQLLGQELLTIIPSIYAKNHRKYITNLLETGKDTLLNQSRNMFAFHSKHYIIPVTLYATISPNLTYGINFVGMLKQLETVDIILLTDTKGIISCMNQIGQEFFDLNFQQLSSQDFYIQRFSNQLSYFYNLLDQQSINKLSRLDTYNKQEVEIIEAVTSIGLQIDIVQSMNNIQQVNSSFNKKSQANCRINDQVSVLGYVVRVVFITLFKEPTGIEDLTDLTFIDKQQLKVDMYQSFGIPLSNTQMDLNEYLLKIPSQASLTNIDKQGSLSEEFSLSEIEEITKIQMNINSGNIYSHVPILMSPIIMSPMTEQKIIPTSLKFFQHTALDKYKSLLNVEDQAFLESDQYTDQNPVKFPLKINLSIENIKEKQKSIVQLKQAIDHTTIQRNFSKTKVHNHDDLQSITQTVFQSKQIQKQLRKTLTNCRWEGQLRYSKYVIVFLTSVIIIFSTVLFFLQANIQSKIIFYTNVSEIKTQRIECLTFYGIEMLKMYRLLCDQTITMKSYRARQLGIIQWGEQFWNTTLQIDNFVQNFPDELSSSSNQFQAYTYNTQGEWVQSQWNMFDFAKIVLQKALYVNQTSNYTSLIKQDLWEVLANVHNSLLNQIFLPFLNLVTQFKKAVSIQNKLNNYTQGIFLTLSAISVFSLIVIYYKVFYGFTQFQLNQQRQMIMNLQLTVKEDDIDLIINGLKKFKTLNKDNDMMEVIQDDCYQREFQDDIQDRLQVTSGLQKRKYHIKDGVLNDFNKIYSKQIFALLMTLTPILTLYGLIFQQGQQQQQIQFNLLSFQLKSEEYGFKNNILMLCIQHLYVNEWTIYNYTGSQTFLNKDLDAECAYHLASLRQFQQQQVQSYLDESKSYLDMSKSIQQYSTSDLCPLVVINNCTTTFNGILTQGLVVLQTKLLIMFQDIYDIYYSKIYNLTQLQAYWATPAYTNMYTLNSLRMNVTQQYNLFLKNTLMQSSNQLQSQMLTLYIIFYILLFLTVITNYILIERVLKKDLQSIIEVINYLPPDCIIRNKVILNFLKNNLDYNLMSINR